MHQSIVTVEVSTTVAFSKTDLDALLGAVQDRIQKIQLGDHWNRRIEAKLDSLYKIEEKILKALKVQFY